MRRPPLVVDGVVFAGSGGAPIIAVYFIQARAPFLGDPCIATLGLRIRRVASGSLPASAGRLDVHLPGPVHGRWTSTVADMVADLPASV